VNVFVHIETWCANGVERAFAFAFPSVLEPVQIARRLVATLETSYPPADADRASRYVVRISPGDAARLEPERAGLEAQWTRMVRALCARAGLAGSAPPSVALSADPGLPRGAIAIDDAHPKSEPAAPASAVLRLECGVPEGAAFPLPGDGASVVVGRDPACGIALADPRVSRRHVRIAARGGELHFEDLASSNGTRHNGVPRVQGRLRLGDRLEIGDSVLALELSGTA
jgi:hypothetical protein